jgi:capsular exopolysaccharide synthesis family protein
MTEKTIVLPPASSGNGHDANYRLTVMVPKRRYFSYLRERWLVILVCLAVSVGAMVYYQTTRRDTYTSVAQLYLSGDVHLWAANMFSEDSANYFGTQIELLKSPRLQSAALEKAGIKLKLSEKLPYKIDIYQPMKTTILALRATGPDPGLVQNYLKALLDEYLAYKKDTRKSTTEEIVDSLKGELAKRELELKTNQDMAVDFQKTNNMAVLEEESKSTGTYLSDLNLELSKLKMEHELLENEIASTNTAAEVKLASTFPVMTNSAGTAAGTNQASGSSDFLLTSARVELAVLVAERAAKTNELSAMHPIIRRLNDEIAQMRERVAAMESQSLQDKRQKLEDLEKRMAAIQAAIPRVQSSYQAINDRISENQRLKNDVTRQQDYYDHLLVMLQSVDLGKNVQQERLAVLQDPTSGVATPQYTALQIILAALGGIFLSLAIVFVWYLLDDRFVSVRDIKDQFGEMVLGLVPQIRVPRSKPQQVLLEASDSRRAYAECYRHLRSALLLSSLGESRPQTLLFTGASPAEGKTTIAVNLARVLARSGLKVLLADMDLHQGGINRLLEAGDGPGVMDFLRGEATSQDILRPTNIPGLSFVSAGTHAEHAEGLFLRPQFEQLMAELRKDNDFVILDGAPILSADDVALLVPHANVVVMVVRPFYTKSRLVRQSLDMLYQRQAKNVAIVLNRARADDLAGHYGQNGTNRLSRNGSKAKVEA